LFSSQLIERETLLEREMAARELGEGSTFTLALPRA